MDLRRVGAWIATLVAVCGCALPATAAADPGTVTITSCKNDGMTVAGKVVVTGNDARKVRGAVLQMRFDAFSLFGLPQTGTWRAAGKKTRASGQQAFSGLGADNWIGVLEWRYKKGRKTVMSDTVRSTPLKIAGKRGIANCTLAEGAKPIDSTPPKVYIRPTDGDWHHAPASVQIVAQDDFSGVARVQYSVDGGPATQVANGGTFTIATEGAHNVAYSATDVAGNTANGSAVIKVDAAPPSKPVVTGPASITANRQPTISWNPSVDTGSGVRGYFVAIRRADGSAVVLQPVDANTTSLVSPSVLDDGQTYTVTITAVDNTADQAWASDSDPYTFTVDTSVDATGFNPASGTVLSGDLKKGPFSITLDRPADPTTVSPSTVVLSRPDGAQTSYSAGCANNPCTTITVAPSAALPEGHYTLSLSGVKSAAEGLAFSGSAVYAVPYVEGGSGPSASTTTLGCSTTPSGVTVASSQFAVSATGPGQSAYLDFDLTYSGSGGWSVQAFYGGTAIGTSLSGAAGGHYRLTFPLDNRPAGNVSFKLSVGCPANTSAQMSNLTGAVFP